MPTSRQKNRFLLTQTKAEFRTVFLPLLFKINTKFNFARQLQCQAFLLNNVPDRQRTESCLHLKKSKSTSKQGQPTFFPPHFTFTVSTGTLTDCQVNSRSRH